MEQLGLKPSDLAKILGGRSRVSEVLNRKRKLTVEMMRSLHKHLAIPADSLLA
jgi:HTH-type transcriptional regulator/antitoxin HigA